MKQFVPIGYVPLCEGVEEAGKACSERFNIEWIPELRKRILPSSSLQKTARSVDDLSAMMLTLSAPEADLERDIADMIFLARLDASGLAELHCIEAWRIWLGRNTQEASKLGMGLMPVMTKYDTPKEYATKRAEMESTQEERAKMKTLAEAAFAAKPLPAEQVTQIRKQAEAEFGIWRSVKLRDEVEHLCRQYLHGKSIPAWLLHDGMLFPVKYSFWGTEAGGRAVASANDSEHKVPVETANGSAVLTGRVLVGQGVFKKAMSTPTEKPVAEQEIPGQSSPVTQRKTANFLTDIMKTGKDESKHTKNLLFTECKNHVKPAYLSDRAFEGAYKIAKGAQTTHEDWKKTRVPKND